MYCLLNHSTKIVLFFEIRTFFDYFFCFFMVINRLYFAETSLILR
ncbi:hypothetical protein HMPREF9074_08704 [Capnocytophaga sp. oral taxon 329 str. F0087]|nr:hypothetical protein HMPREF9074_08704 [Capnocytophaga sp. oral taxon 329 str. F0087]